VSKKRRPRYEPRPLKYQHREYSSLELNKRAGSGGKWGRGRVPGADLYDGKPSNHNILFTQTIPARSQGGVFLSPFGLRGI